MSRCLAPSLLHVYAPPSLSRALSYSCTHTDTLTTPSLTYTVWLYRSSVRSMVNAYIDEHEDSEFGRVSTFTEDAGTDALPTSSFMDMRGQRNDVDDDDEEEEEEEDQEEVEADLRMLLNNPNVRR